MNPGEHITRHHHITISTGDAQEDYDFHTKVLGLKSVKKTLLYDGRAPIYHLYYGNDVGEESSLVTTFPVKHVGLKGRKGSGQIAYVSLSVPDTALSYWHERLAGMGFEVRERETLGERHLDFQHPCGVDYCLTGVVADSRAPHSTGPVPVDCMIRGTHSICVSARDATVMEEFMQLGWGGTRVADDGNYIRYQLGDGQSGTFIDFRIDPDLAPGSWTIGEGTIHHMAFQVADHEKQGAIKAHLEGMGFTDVSDVKDRGYFDSIYVRTPSGAMFEATVSHDPSFACDEPLDKLGLDVMVSPQFADDKAELLSQLGYLQD
ncbi:MAG: glyoxalase [Pseudomonadota bacterium]